MSQITKEQVERLNEVFALLKDKTNWKRPINSTILAHLAAKEEIVEAVVFIAGCVPTVTSCQIPARHPRGLTSFMFDAWHVEAVGYYAAIGA